jgi:hypothetical protein
MDKNTEEPAEQELMNKSVWSVKYIIKFS